MEIKTAIEVMEGVKKQYSRRQGVKEAIAMSILALKEVEKHEETFEWCAGCKEYDYERHCCPRWSKLIRDTVKDLKEQYGIISCRECINRNTDNCPVDDDFIERNPWFYCGTGDKDESCVDVAKALATVDSVKVVRCGECKFVGTDATYCLVCNREGMGLRPFHVYPADYCSYGERKDGDKDGG